MQRQFFTRKKKNSHVNRIVCFALTCFILLIIKRLGPEAGNHMVTTDTLRDSDPSLSEPAPEVLVALLNKHFLWRYDPQAIGFSTNLLRQVPGCTYQGFELKCRFVQVDSEAKAVEIGADAVMWHAPTFCWVGRRPSGAKHLRIVTSTESSIYYNCLDDPGFMSQFDAEMTYRMCSQVPLHYFVDKYASLTPSGFFKAPVPFRNKLDAIAVVTNNCQIEGAFSGRTRILLEVKATLERRNSAVKFMSYGKCNQNVFTGVGDKITLFSKHKFCVAMENSITQDYVTEKLWDALVAGCVPVYLGAPNIEDFLPDNKSIIRYGYGHIQTPEDLVDELERLAANENAYNEMLNWKTATDARHLSPNFQTFLQQTEVHLPHAQCRMCSLVASHRARPRQFTTCLWNKTWLEHAGRAPPRPG